MYAIDQTIKEIKRNRYRDKLALIALEIKRRYSMNHDTKITKIEFPKQKSMEIDGICFPFPERSCSNIKLKEIKDELVDRLCEIGPIRVIIEDYLDGDYHTYHLRLADRIFILWQQGYHYFHYNPRIGYITNHRDQTFKITKVNSGVYEICDTLVQMITTPQPMIDYILKHFNIPIDHEDVQLISSLVNQLFYK
jgi:hypothetical protein